MTKAFAAALSVAALVAAFPALAADIDATSKIAAVTVFPDGAIISRVVEVDLPAGATTLVFKGLPLSVDPASLRVEGKASAALTLGAVESRLTPVDPARTASEAEAQIKALRGERAKVAAALEAHEGRKAMVLRFAQTGTDRPGDKAAVLDVGQWGAAWEAVGGALAKANEDIRLAREAAQDIDLKIRAAELADQARRSRVAPERAFTVALEAGAALKGQLTLSYRVTGAGWRPAYDARLTTAEGGKAGGLTLARRALVSQRSGEDWSGVEMTLSTVRAARGTAAPEVDPQRVAFYEVMVAAPVPAGRVRSEMVMRDAARAAPGVAETAAPMAAPAPVAMQKVAAAEAQMESDGYQATYRIPGALSVPSDGSQKSFIVQSRDIQPELLIKAAPALDPTAYLEAAFINTEDAPLLAGEVTLIRDNAFVGRGRLAFVAPGDRASLGFGADDRVKVARVPVRRRETEPSLLGSTKSDTREFKITVKNLHDFAVKATIVDQLPFSEISTLTVEPLAAMTPPTEKVVADKRGVMGWTYDLKPKEEREIKLGYRIRYPSDRELTFQPAPNAR